MARVNPPPHLRTPKEFLNQGDTRNYFQQMEYIIFQLWTRTGGGTDSVELALNDIPLSNASQLNALEIEVRGGNALTSDETGFTVDSDKLTVDMTIA